MALILNFQLPSGLALPASYHRVQRITLDLHMRAATIEVAVHHNRGAREAGNPELPWPSLSFVCQNLQGVPISDPSTGQYTRTKETPLFDQWFSAEALAASGRNVYSQAYVYLKTNVPLYEQAEEA